MNLHHHEVWVKQRDLWGNPQGQSQQSRNVYDPEVPHHPAGRHAGAKAPAEVGRALVQGRGPQPPGSSFIWDRCGTWPRQWLCTWLLVLARLDVGAAVTEVVWKATCQPLGTVGTTRNLGTVGFPCQGRTQSRKKPSECHFSSGPFLYE